MSDAPPPFDALWFLTLSGFVIGVAIGSFITMLSHRLPNKMSIVFPSSHCPACKKTLRARDLIPIFSWVLAKGQCRYCGTVIGKRYVVIEATTGVISALLFIIFGFRLILVAALLAMIVLVTFLSIKFIEK